MGTRSRIGILNADGTIKSVYCHWDGYPEWNGIKLRDYYSTPELAERITSMGDMSSLGEKIDPNPNEPHTFDNSQNGVTVFYHRDRKERLAAPLIYKTIDDYVTNSYSDSWAEFVYLWDGDKWRCWSTLHKDEIDLSKIGDDD